MSMNDREMLELAAKAADQERSFADDLWSNATGRRWNPLADDGDALRLAVKLDLSSLVVFSSPENRKRREFWSPNSGYDGGKSATTETEYLADPLAATRRAIVRAAAEIGKAMP